ncbi:hypothetical protein F511_01007 [Dorcoceras hygrometricum]|uniref:Uncharacterized protein n=1 Tax=Dorcoceras hygrometricum TaxID=472368 RepID=A0A2Z7AFR4_9LAMI|nr:hypothetical protein F511_01007 [Dorcoceras hygrometricum]
MLPRVQPVYVSTSLNYEIIGNHGDNIAQDKHQSRRNSRRDKCPSASRPEYFRDSDHPSILRTPDDPISRAPEVVIVHRLIIRLHQYE